MNAMHAAMEIAMKFDENGETDNAKQCALIYVNDMIEELTESFKIFIYIGLSDESNLPERVAFYQEVKQEIIKL
jgi:hypothetical protein